MYIATMADDVSSTVPGRTIPKFTEHNRAFLTGGAEGKLLITRCVECALWVHPPVADCPDCGGALQPRPVSGRATVFAYTVNHQPFNPAVAVPYIVAIVELVEHPDLRLATNIVDCQPESMRVGLPVEVRFEHHDVDGDGIFISVFAPQRNTTV